MGSSYGERIRMTIFGQSHSPAIGMTLEGIPAGKRIDPEQLQTFLDRRAPGRNTWSTPRREADRPEFLSGIVNGRTCGTPISAIIRNTNTRSGDYTELKIRPRPGHADYTAEIRYRGFQDFAGGGHFSGRLTAPLCIAGGICLQLLAEQGITVLSRIFSIADVQDEGELRQPAADPDFPVLSSLQGERMKQRIEEARAEEDSVGGIIECCVQGLPAGLGDPMFHGMENRIASAVFGIPAIKGIEFGSGFGSALLRGSENNDAYTVQNGKMVTQTNHCGGILGGITNGMPLSFRVAVKPAPSIARPQQTVDLTTGETVTLRVRGRHDPCIVPRAVPCVEAAAALAIYDAMMEQANENI